MITNFKIYEKWKNGKYWKIRINDFLLRYRLKKIGMDFKNIQYWISKSDGSPLSNIFDKNKFIYIGYDGERWLYSPENYKEDFERNEVDEPEGYYIYQGVIDDLTIREINKYKKEIEIEKDLNKYNL